MKKGNIFEQPETDLKKKLFHLYLKQSDTHKYYGSLQAVFDDNAAEDLGISKYTLDRYDFSNPFENEIMVLRKGETLTTGDVRKDKGN